MRVSKNEMKAVGLFCGSQTGRAPRYAALAAAFGAEVARSGLTLVYGGGGVGLMGKAARAAHAEGGRVLGVIPEFLTWLEAPFTQGELVIVQTMHERKAQMEAAADGFVVMPGGIGTLEETVEILSWARLGLHRKPCLFLDDDGYWDPLFALVDHQVEQGFTAPELRALMLRASEPRAALRTLAAACAAS